ncbi:T9SS type A sorting domain-containing protein [Gangjinia marincola]
MKKITSKKLLKYGAMSAAILGASSATGQIVYTDLDPDQDSQTGDAFPFDLNDDGIDDFSLDIFDAAGGPGAVIFPGINGSVNSSNGFIGFTAGNYTYPANLSSGAVIDGNATIVEGNRGDLNFYGCAYSNSQFCDDTIDGFIGLKFVVDGNTHYGWVRLDLTGDASNMIIKDFAFNATPDTAINAGDQGDLSIEDSVFEGFDYFNNNDELTLRASNSLEKVEIFNVLGQKVTSQLLNNQTETIQINSLESGVYFVNAVIEGRNKSFKITKR